MRLVYHCTACAGPRADSETICPPIHVARGASPASSHTQSARCPSAIEPMRSSSDRKAAGVALARSEEHTSELQSLMRILYAVFCWKKQKPTQHHMYLVHPNKRTTHTNT